MDGPACPAKGPAMKYISEVQNRYSDDPAVYKQFLKIVMDSQKNPSAKTTTEVEQNVKVLFGDHPDLIEGFKQFLPGETAHQEKEDVSQVDTERQQQLLKMFAEYNENPTSLSELSGRLKAMFGEDPNVLKLLDQYKPATKGA